LSPIRSGGLKKEGITVAGAGASGGNARGKTLNVNGAEKRGKRKEDRGETAKGRRGLERNRVRGRVKTTLQVEGERGGRRQELDPHAPREEKDFL